MNQTFNVDDEVAHLSRHGSHLYARVGPVVEVRQHQPYSWSQPEEQVKIRFLRDSSGPIDKVSSWISPENCLLISEATRGMAARG